MLTAFFQRLADLTTGRLHQQLEELQRMSDQNAEQIAALQAALDEQAAALEQERAELAAERQRFEADKATLSAQVQSLGEKVAELEGIIANETGPVDLVPFITAIRAHTTEIQALVNPPGADAEG